MPMMRKTTLEEADAIHDVWFMETSAGVGDGLQALADAIDDHIAKLQGEDMTAQFEDY
jgi:hypothetical protein